MRTVFDSPTPNDPGPARRIDHWLIEDLMDDVQKEWEHLANDD